MEPPTAAPMIAPIGGDFGGAPPGLEEEVSLGGLLRFQKILSKTGSVH